ncbi:unnamed protein product, partial [Symbiodinium sp. CCMP2456]
MSHGCSDDGLDAFRAKVDAVLGGSLSSWTPRARVFHRRSFGHLNFYDALMVDPDSKRSFLVEFVIRFRDDIETCNESEPSFKGALGYVTSHRDIRIGDVVEILSGQMDEKLPKPPCHFTIKVSQMRIAELWTEMFIQSEAATAAEEEGARVSKARGKPCNHQASKYGFHRPVFHDGIDQSWFVELDRMNEQKGEEKRRQKREAKKAGKETQQENAPHVTDEDEPLCIQLGTTDEELDFLRSLVQGETEEADADHSESLLRQILVAKQESRRRSRPRAFLQCHFPQAERLAAYLDGQVLSTCTRDRLVLLSWGQELLDPPKDTCGKVLTSLAKLYRQRQAEVLGSPGGAAEDGYEVRMPVHLHSVIQRVYFASGERKAPSLV